MSTQHLAEALLRMLRSDRIALEVRNGGLESFADLTLSGAEKAALTKKIERWETGLIEVGTVGAWGLLTKDIANVSKATKDELNKELAARQTISTSIPVTGS